jgi:hypothetical protein
MEKSGAQFVHGRDEQHRYLETVARRPGARRPDLRRIQSARLHFVFIDCLARLGAGHERLEIGHRSEAPKASPNRAHGAIAERAPGISHPL